MLRGRCCANRNYVNCHLLYKYYKYMHMDCITGIKVEDVIIIINLLNYTFLNLRNKFIGFINILFNF